MAWLGSIQPGYVGGGQVSGCDGHTPRPFDTLVALRSSFAGFAGVALFSDIPLISPRDGEGEDVVITRRSPNHKGVGSRSTRCCCPGQDTRSNTCRPPLTLRTLLTLRSLDTLRTTNLTDVRPPGAIPNMKMTVRFCEVALTDRAFLRKIIGRGDSTGDSDRATIITLIALGALLTINTVGSGRTLDASVALGALVTLRWCARVSFSHPPVPGGSDVWGHFNAAVAGVHASLYIIR